MTDLYLIRHAEAVGQNPEAGLNEGGRRHALRLADSLAGAGIRRIISSPYRRAVETVAPLPSRLSIRVELDGRLVERVLAGEPRDDWLSALEASFLDPDLRLPGGESSREATQRIEAVMNEARWNECRTALVTHGCLLALGMMAIDESSGFETWRELTNPDVYNVTGGSVTRISLD